MHTIKDFLKKYLLHSVFIGLLPLLLLRAGVAQATSPSPTHQKAWKVISSPNVGISDQLNGVAAISRSDVWAVGVYNNSNNFQQTLIEQWNGTSWSVVSSPNVGSNGNFLNAVAAVSASDIWAVGKDPQGALIEHWDGSSWSDIDDGLQDKILSAVAAISAKNAWAVGYSDYPQTLIEHWDGAQWSIVPSPAPGSYSQLYGVARVPGTKQLWTVGGYGASNLSTLIEFYG